MVPDAVGEVKRLTWTGMRDTVMRSEFVRKYGWCTMPEMFMDHVTLVHSGSARAVAVAARISEAAYSVGIHVSGMLAEPYPEVHAVLTDALRNSFSPVFSVGGDGFLLDVIRLLRSDRVSAWPPIVGWHAGTVGFLMNAVPEDDADLTADLTDLAAGHYESASFRRLHASVDTLDGATREIHAFNEVEIEKVRGQAVHLDVTVDGCALGTWVGRGCIVATPQGATGSQLSAGGAVVDWRMPALTVAMVSPAPHRAYGTPQRPIVFPGWTTFAAVVRDPEKRPVCVYADGEREWVDCVRAMRVRTACDEPQITLCFPYARGAHGGRRFLRQYSRVFLGVE